MRKTDSGCWIMETPADIKTLTVALSNHPTWVVGVDVETKPLDPKRKEPNARVDTLVGVGVSYYRDEPDAIDASPELTIYGLAFEEYLAFLRQDLSKRKWYAHNALFDCTVLDRYDVKLGEHIGDPRIIAYLLGEPEAGLKPLLANMGFDIIDYNDLLIEYGAKTIDEVPLNVQAMYCGSQDAEKVVWLERTMRMELKESNPRAFDVYTKVELPMVQILVDMSDTGVRYNRVEGAKRYDAKHRRRVVLDTEIARMVREAGFVEYEKRAGKIWEPTCKGCRNGAKKRVNCVDCNGRGKLNPIPMVFNPGSWQQRGRFLYEFLGIPKRRYAGNIKPWMITRGMVDVDELEGSTDALAMLQMKDRHPTIPLLIVRNKLQKDEGFLRKWNEASEADGRLHTTFTNTTVSTGRLSSRDPNLTQVELTYRDLMEADDDTEIIAGDMSQLELVIMAYASQDPVMCEAIRNGWNLHQITAEAIYEVPWRDIPKSSPMYATAKVANYLTSYGGKEDKLIEGIEKMVLTKPGLGLNVPTHGEARRIIRAHQTKYARYNEWCAWTVLRTRELGYSETMFGRPRYFPEIQSPNSDLRSAAERAAINLPIQGTAADLMKMVMVNISRDTEMAGWGIMILQVHDEIVSIVRRLYVEQYKERLQTHMMLGQPFEPIVPLVVTLGSGPNWKACHA